MHGLSVAAPGPGTASERSAAACGADGGNAPGEYTAVGRHGKLDGGLGCREVSHADASDPTEWIQHDPSAGTATGGDQPG